MEKNSKTQRQEKKKSSTPVGHDSTFQINLTCDTGNKEKIKKSRKIKPQYSKVQRFRKSLVKRKPSDSIIWKHSKK